MISYSKIKVHIDLDALADNYNLLKKFGPEIIPVIKSDAYGHGLGRVAGRLEKEGADKFAVGFVHEAADLRDSGCSGTIISLLGPQDADDHERLKKGDIIPFVGHFDTLRALAASQEKPLDVSIKFDTGMSRLGFTQAQVPELIEFLRANPMINPVMASSHLAVADEPDGSEITGSQIEVFKSAVSALRESGYAVRANLANSAATLEHKDCLCDMQRVGIALYGCNPFAGTSWEKHVEGLRPAMEVTAPVMHVHTLGKGRGISYGHTYVADRDRTVAVVGVGYADCYSRGLSNTGHMNFDGVRVPIVGRVCMQMTCVDVSGVEAAGKSIKVGDEIHLLGGPGQGKITPEELAGWWKTITYEVFCVLGMNRRIYI